MACGVWNGADHRETGARGGSSFLCRGKALTTATFSTRPEPFLFIHKHRYRVTFGGQWLLYDDFSSSSVRLMAIIIIII
jgi:hypothetical protein